jgi:hypothetical protein
MDRIGVDTGASGIEVMEPQGVADISLEQFTETGKFCRSVAVVGGIGEIDQDGIDAWVMMETSEFLSAVVFVGVTLVVVFVKIVAGKVTNHLERLVRGGIGAREQRDLVEYETDVRVVRMDPAGLAVAVGGFGSIVFDFRKGHAFLKSLRTQTVTQVWREKGRDDDGRDVIICRSEIVSSGQKEKEDEKEENKEERKTKHLEIERIILLTHSEPGEMQTWHRGGEYRRGI